MKRAQHVRGTTQDGGKRCGKEKEGGREEEKDAPRQLGGLRRYSSKSPSIA